MNKKEQIALLLDRFMAAETTEAEERQLAEYFRTATDIPAEWQPYADMLQIFDEGATMLTERELQDYTVVQMPHWHLAFQPRRWSAAATLAALLSIGAAAAGITYHIATREPVAKEQQAATSVPKARKSAARAQQQAPQDDVRRLEEDLAFENITLADIARQITAALGAKVIIDDASLSELRLYMTLPKGSTAADFTALIDAYDALAATLADGIITIKKEARR